MSMGDNLERFLERTERDPERDDPDRRVEGEEDSRSAVEEALPPRDEDEAEDQREHSESDDPQP